MKERIARVSIGHLVELQEPEAYGPRWKRWSLPMLPTTFALRPAKKTLAQWRVVRDLLKQRGFEAVVNACDAGREGELIFGYVYARAESTLPIERLWISSLTSEATTSSARGKSLVAQDKGLALIEALPDPTLRSAELTGAWEARLQRIADGGDAADPFMADVRRLVTETVSTLTNKPVTASPSPPIGLCPRCRATVVERRSALCEMARGTDRQPAVFVRQDLSWRTGNHSVLTRRDESDCHYHLKVTCNIAIPWSMLKLQSMLQPGVVMTRKLGRAQAKALSDQLDAYGIGHELEAAQGLFVIWVRRSDLALARALTGVAGVQPALTSRSREWLLRRAAVPLLAAGAVLVAGMGWSAPEPDRAASVEGYRGNVYHADDDHDGRVDRMVVFGTDGRPASVLRDRGGDGVMDQFLRIGVGSVSELVDTDGDGIPDAGRP